MIRFKSTNTNYSKKLEQFTARAHAIDARLIELAALRREVALAATDGDESALKRIEQLDAEASALNREVETLISASEQIRLLEQQAAAEVSKQDRVQREQQRRTIIDALMVECAAIDTGYHQQNERHQHVTKLLEQLAATKTVSSNLTLRLHQKFVGTAAARAAGLGSYLALEHIAPSHIVPLVQSFAVLQRPLAAAEEDAA